MKKIITNRVLKLCILPIVVTLCVCFLFTGCSLETDTGGSKADTATTIEKANTLQTNQPTPSDIDYSLERYNLIRRAYWVNGKREKANTLPCEVEKPLDNKEITIIQFTGNDENYLEVIESVDSVVCMMGGE